MNDYLLRDVAEGALWWLTAAAKSMPSPTPRRFAVPARLDGIF
jgi:hypothetical protein